MSADRIETPLSTGAENTPSEPSDGSVSADDVLVRDVVLLRARCSNLRHWCLTMLDEPSAAGVLDDATATDIRAVAPEVTEPEGQAVVALLARGGTVPPNHPLAPEVDDAESLRAVVTPLAAEHERLRRAFFAIYDHLYPGDDLTDEYFLAQQGEPTGKSIGELIAEFEREEETKS